MNQVRLLKNDEEKKVNEIVLNLDSEQKLAFDIDLDYIVTLAMEHLIYKFDKNAIFNKKSFKASKIFFTKHCNQISDIISEKVITTIENIANYLKDSNESMQSRLDALNVLNLEAYILSIISETITNEMFALLRQNKKMNSSK